MSDYVKHEWPHLNGFDWSQEITPDIYSAYNKQIRRKITPETLYQAFIARMKSEGLIFELEKINRNELDRKIYHTDGLNAAELQADAGRSTKAREHDGHSLFCRCPEHGCTCSATEYK